jgi:hypothetical protein
MKKKVFALLVYVNVCCLNAQTLPTPDHIIIVMMENKGYSQIIGSSNAPYINSLISDPHCALFSDSHGITHPSQPNYLQLFSGSNQGVTTDNQDFTTPYSTCNLAHSLIVAGHTFKGYSEGLPAAGSLTYTAGTFVRRHCPWASWIGTGTNQINANLHQPYTSFPAVASYSSLPTVSFIIPDNAHNMHDPILTASTGIINGDTWLSNNMPNLISWVKTHNSLLIIQYDEDESLTGTATVNTIPTMLIGSMVVGGTYSNTFTHYGLLKTIEDMYSLPACGSSAGLLPITNCWTSVTTSIDNVSSQKFQLYPIPTTNQLQVELQEELIENAHVLVTDMYGRLLFMEELTTEDKHLTIDTKNFKSGVYFLSINGNSIHSSQRFVIE